MNWAEEIVGLKPVIVTATYLLVVAIGAALMEAFPIGSVLFWLALPLAASLSFCAIVMWTSALCAVARSRLSLSSVAQQGLAAFYSLAFWWIIWIAVMLVTMLTQRYDLFAIQILATLVAGYFYLRAVWITTSTLLAFENSDKAFWTFVQILYFPVGIWFLRRRLQRLLSASPQTAPSPA